MDENKYYWEKVRFETWLEKTSLTEKVNYNKADMVNLAEKAWIAACQMWEHQTF